VLRRWGASVLFIGVIVVTPAVVMERLQGQSQPRAAALPVAVPVAQIAIDYPAEGSIFPPDMVAPTFLWRDPVENATTWLVDVAFADGSAGIEVKSQGERLRIGEIDPRCVAPTNELPKLTTQQSAERIWTPDPATWQEIKKHSVDRAATVTITGVQNDRAVSRGRVTLQTSKDPVGAPIFYRDVPLMPSELEKGVIKPLAANMVPLIAWRLRNVSEPQSRVLMTGLPTCANCHSFSRDGKTLGIDLDGPNNDKGLYAVAPIGPQMSIRNEDVVSWSSFLTKAQGGQRVGFMSQVSPLGEYVATTIEGSALGNGPSASAGEISSGKPGSKAQLQKLPKAAQDNYYVANFKDYRFLQVFYPTRGILAWYSRATGMLKPLPGANDPQYVQTDGIWSPDGKYLVFARAKAADAYPPGRKMAEYANDPNEIQIQYDLYRIPFNEGQGGRPEPIAGASGNGMSNNFPKVSPDGRWIVFVKCRNGQLMRPDSQLYIVPSSGGTARRMRANTPLMNSWHSFSPNGRWLVFSSKSRSPYTQMYLTHLDENGQDSPAILIENSTAANRAVNIPEFVNIPADGLQTINTPALDFYRLYERALNLTEDGQYEKAIAEWEKALPLSPDDAKANNNFGVALAGSGAYREAIAHYQKALAVQPESAQVHNNMGRALAAEGKLEEAIAHYQKAMAVTPDAAEIHNNLGFALLRKGELDEAIAHFEKAVALDSELSEAHYNLGFALVGQGKLDEAITHYEKAVAIEPDSAEIHNNLGFALLRKGKFDEAIAHFEKAVAINPEFGEAHYNLGNVLYYMKGKIPEALIQWRDALHADPNAVPVLNQTARVLATTPEASLRSGGEAVAFAERAVKLSGGSNPGVLDTLAAAYANVGRFREAVETARQARDFATRQNNQRLSEGVNARISLYEAGTPFREAPPSSPAPLRLP
jgi:tetratricopeptide (TPR) repeat protein